MLAYPEGVAPAVESAGDHTHVVIIQTHHGQVGVEPAARGEPRGVDGPSDIHVHLVDGQVVGEGHRTRTGQIEDLESGEVDHADVFPEGQVFGVDDRRPPATVPFGVPFGDAVLFH